MKGYTILVVPISAVGHVNACRATTLELLKRGNRVVFLVEQPYSGSLQEYGFEEHIYCVEPVDQPAAGPNPGEALANSLLEWGIIGPTPLETKFQRTLEFFLFSEGALKTLVATNRSIKAAIELYRPDAILVDGVYLLPAIAQSGIPWIKHISTTPLFYLNQADLPPGGSGTFNCPRLCMLTRFKLILNFAVSGYPIDQPDRQKWDHFNEVRKEFFYSKRWNDHLQQMGYARYPDDILMPETQILTIYAYPEELNYSQIHSKPWFNLEAFDKAIDENIKLKDLLPDTFLDETLGGSWSGKFIFLSMGSMGSIELNLMRRLVELLGRTKHKYVVSKGPRSQEYQLPTNMWGDRFLPQTAILPLVDLVNAAQWKKGHLEWMRWWPNLSLSNRWSLTAATTPRRKPLLAVNLCSFCRSLPTNLITHNDSKKLASDPTWIHTNSLRANWWPNWTDFYRMSNCTNGWTKQPVAFNCLTNTSSCASPLKPFCQICEIFVRIALFVLSDINMWNI